MHIPKCWDKYFISKNISSDKLTRKNLQKVPEQEVKAHPLVALLLRKVLQSVLKSVYKRAKWVKQCVMWPIYLSIYVV